LILVANSAALPPYLPQRASARSKAPARAGFAEMSAREQMTNPEFATSVNIRVIRRRTASRGRPHMHQRPPIRALCYQENAMPKDKTIRKKVNRKASDYHAQRLSEITFLDKVASYLLAVSYSERTSPTQVSQSLIQMDCAAVAVINGEWLVATNSRKLTESHMEKMASEYGEDLTYAIVERGTGGMHAEMQVLEEIKASNYSLVGVSIGVSKPCCKKCKDELDKWHACYTHYHEDKVVNWEAPDLS
jgi:hypothetical protein